MPLMTGLRTRRREQRDNEQCGTPTSWSWLWTIRQDIGLCYNRFRHTPFFCLTHEKQIQQRNRHGNSKTTGKLFPFPPFSALFHSFLCLFLLSLPKHILSLLLGFSCPDKRQKEVAPSLLSLNLCQALVWFSLISEKMPKLIHNEATEESHLEDVLQEQVNSNFCISFFG